MSSGILGQLYASNRGTPVVRRSSFEVWWDLFCYAKNLKGNWHKSQEIFNNYIAPTAIEHPEYFAQCVEDMVKVSGVKIKRRSTFMKSLKALKSLKKKSFEREKIILALTDMLFSGLQEPYCAEKAIYLRSLPAQG